jgi:DNA topoisomerase VI subunit A
VSTQAYIDKNFSKENLALVQTMNAIVDEYVAAGYRLTVRQLYYQLVARAVVENTEKSYKNVTRVVNDAKLAGLMDWDAIEDRTREFIRRQRWESAAAIVRAAADSFHMDMWEGQKKRVVCIVEKEALAGVLERACRQYDVPLLAARGYPSGTVLREFSISDILPAIRTKPGQRVIVLHLGDHDPSGIDMTRDLRERLQMFSDAEFDVEELNRIALTMDQIQDQKPPPNPAKTTDTRFARYRRKFGVESWELDALKPTYLDRLVTGHIKKHIVKKVWDARAQEVETLRAKITKVADKFEKDNA